MAERKWTNEEAERLIELAGPGLSVEEIGERLDRTGGAVRVKANRIGLDSMFEISVNFQRDAETKCCRA